MRRAAFVLLVLALLVALPLGTSASAAAPREERMRYVVADDSPAQFRLLPTGERVGVNGVVLFPLEGETRASITVRDAAGPSVSIGVCHEWTYDDGSHPTRTCWPRACGPTLDVALPARPAGATYQRLVVFLFDAPWGCASRATTGEVVAAFA